jgi:hypothetical protein
MSDVTERVRELVERRLSLRDAAQALDVHEKALAKVCICAEYSDYRGEHPRCPKHVLDVERRLRAHPRGTGALIG